MQDAQAELRRRRERGRAAQRAFRQRQSDALQSLKGDHERLKRLITQIVDAARASDPAQLNEAIVEAAQAVGLNITSVAAPTYLDTPPQTCGSSGGGGGGNDGKSNSPLETTTCTTALEESMSSPTALAGQKTSFQAQAQAQDPAPGPVATATAQHETSFPTQSQGASTMTASSTTDLQAFDTPPVYDSYARSGRMSPRLDYGLWLDPDRFVKIREPPVDIAPYVGSGRHTVAGHIAWACLDLANTCLQDAMGKPKIVTTPKPSGSLDTTSKSMSTACIDDIHDIHDIHDIDISVLSPGKGYLYQDDDYPSILPPNSIARRMFDLALRHSKPLHDITYLAAVLQARVDFHKLGYMRGDSPGADAASHDLMVARVSDDLAQKGTRMEQWWSPLEIETHVAEKMGPAEFSAFQQALRRREKIQTDLLMPLTGSLAPRAVCFGHGPRWRADHAASLVSSWVSWIYYPLEETNFE